jgi:hypothetical protein
MMSSAGATRLYRTRKAAILELEQCVRLEPYHGSGAEADLAGAAVFSEKLITSSIHFPISCF